jgi:hypothetical protein
MQLFLMLFLFLCQSVNAQQFTFPRLNQAGLSIASLTPSNWKVIDSTYGDLNNDRLTDLIFILEYHIPIKEKRAYGSPDIELVEEFQKPRMLAIYFKQPNKSYAFAMQHNDFVLRSEEGGAFGDPYESISILDHSFKIIFCGGANFRWKLAYDFKYENSSWVLIRANKVDYENSTGDMQEKNWDFVNRKLKLTTGSFQHEEANKVTVKTLAAMPLRTFKDFKKPWTWEIWKDEFL